MPSVLCRIYCIKYEEPRRGGPMARVPCGTIRFGPYSLSHVGLAESASSGNETVAGEAWQADPPFCLSLSLSICRPFFLRSVRLGVTSGLPPHLIFAFLSFFVLPLVAVDWGFDQTFQTACLGWHRRVWFGDLPEGRKNWGCCLSAMDHGRT